MRFNVLDYGILPDGKTNNTKKINELIKKAASVGGEIYFPKGEYLSGTVFFEDGVTLFLDEGATLLGSEDFCDYPLISVEGYTRGGHWGLISALEKENITLAGKGKIDARGGAWWKSGKDDLVRPRTISFILSKNVVIRDVTITNSPCWTIHPMCCEDVLIENVSIFNPYKSPNTDGINPESSKNVVIRNCHLDVGDDCIAIKSGTEDDLLQKRYPCENVTIEGCTMAHGHGGVVIGSEMSGGVINVVIKDCIFRNTDRGIRLKTRRMRGGRIEGIRAHNITMENPLAAITFNEYYYYGTLSAPPEEVFDKEAREITPLTPVIKDVFLSDINATGIKGVGIYMLGLPEMPIENIVMNNLNLDIVGCENAISAVSALDREKSKGDGIFLENVHGVEIEDLEIKCPLEKYILKNAEDVKINGADV